MSLLGIANSECAHSYFDFGGVEQFAFFEFVHRFAQRVQSFLRFYAEPIFLCAELSHCDCTFICRISASKKVSLARQSLGF